MSGNFKQQTNIIPIEEIMSESFGKYAKYIIQDRALPDVRDGLKPVQRRIIYAMNQLNLLHSLPHKKSARTVGEVIGKYHPHGDSSIYEAMVRLSQEWKNNICLLDMHGNKGSIDGDSPAAMRYTECRLSSFGELLIEGIKKESVSFIENFDGSETEPTVLPSLYPNLLINGASGIAAGYATNIPPFNPVEVINAIIAKIDTPGCTLARIKTIMPAPDFPTGGIISDVEGMQDAYATGRGKITIRSEIVQLSKKQIEIKSIPFETNKSEIIRNIDRLKEDIEALNITEVRDESDANGISIILETKPSANFEFIKNYLYKSTRLQIAYHLNMVAIVNRKPILMNILDMIQSFIDHADKIILLTSKFDLEKALFRKEIVKGIVKAVLIIDDVVSSIRSANNKQDAIEKLQANFAFTFNQADAIVNLRLYRLTNTDVAALKKELAELETKILELRNLVDNIQARYLFLKEKLRSFKKEYGYERKSVISNVDTKIILDEMDLIENKEAIFVFTKDGYMKNISKKGYLGNDMKDNKIKDGDLIMDQSVCNYRDKNLLFTNDAKVLSVPNHKIESCKVKDIGMHINSILTVEESTKIIKVVNCSGSVSIDHRQIIIATKNGFIKRVEIDELISKKTAKVLNCGKLDDGDAIVAADLAVDENSNILIVTQNGYANIYPISQIPMTSKNVKGVKAIGLKQNDKIADIYILKPEIEQIVIATNFGLKRVIINELSIGNRNNMGKLLSSFILKNEQIKIFKILPYSPKYSVYCIYENNTFEYVDMKQINYLSGTSRIYSIDPQLRDCCLFDEQFINTLKDQNE